MTFAFFTLFFLAIGSSGGGGCGGDSAAAEIENNRNAFRLEGVFFMKKRRQLNHDIPGANPVKQQVKTKTFTNGIH